MGWSTFKQRAARALSWPQRTFWSSAKVEKCAVWLAHRWRPRMHQALVVGVSGSAGKSTTRHLVHALLQSRYGPGIGTPAASYFAFTIAEAVLKLRRQHRFLAAELHEGTPGMMRRIAAILRPDVAILTVARDDHASAFASKADLHDEMEELLRHVPVKGTAILNADDARVMAMRGSCRGRVLSYGLHPEADVRAVDVHAAWPQHLRLTVLHGDASQVLHTRMLSEHWVSAVLAATACGLVAGMALPEIAKVLALVEPFEGRMQECRSRDGVVFIRDDYKAPQWTLPACIEFLRRVQGRRKVLVLGEVSDKQGSKEMVLKRLMLEALEVADLVVVVGSLSSAVLKLKQGDRVERIGAFVRTRDASAFVNAWLRPGDLVLLKGSNKQNHLSRILLDRDGEIHCWRDDCRFDRFCRVCEHRQVALGPPAIPIHAVPDEPAVVATEEEFDYLLLGLGNADAPSYVNTPHNAGFALLEHMAAAHGAEWQSLAWGWQADLSLKGYRLRLAKMRSPMNQIGPKLMPLLDALGLPPERCVLAYDDMATPLGRLTAREGGSAGGHRGVASILEAAQTDTFPRIKLGVAPAQSQEPLRVAEYVLRPFAPDALHTLLSTLAQGEGKLFALLQNLRSRAKAAARAKGSVTRTAKPEQSVRG